MRLARVVSIVIGVIAIGIVVIAFTSKPASVTASSGTDQISAIESDYEVNSSTAENVYQQQVVALWSIKDLDVIQAQQNATLINSQVALLENQSKAMMWSQATALLLVLLIGLIAMWGFVLAQLKGPKGDGAIKSVDGL